MIVPWDAPPNNGMHPTRDTSLVMYPERFGRAGDAGRYASDTSRGVKMP